MVFTNDQVKRLANILDNAGQVVFASAVIPFLVGNFDITFPKMIPWIITMIFCWWVCLRLERISS